MASISFYKPYDNQKENILFLHGFLESSDTWRVFLPELSKTHNCLLYDFPGHGVNLSFPVQDINFHKISSEIVETLIQHNISQTHLVCHSMGGYFGSYLKEHFPGTFKKVVLCNSLLSPDTESQTEKRKKMIRIIKTNKDLLCKMSFQTFDSTIRTHKEAICKACIPEHLVKLQEILASRPDFKHLNTVYPTDLFFVFGENDTHIPWKTTDSLTKKRQCILQNEGHTLPVNSAKKWNAIILDTLK